MDEKEKEYWESYIEAWKEGEYDIPHEWNEKSKSICIRDDLTCQRCGTKDKPLVAHHIFPAGYELHRNHPFLLITYCQKCHGKMRWGAGVDTIEEEDFFLAWKQVWEAIDRCIEKGWIERLFADDTGGYVRMPFVCKAIFEQIYNPRDTRFDTIKIA